jgi:ribosome biogenesis GTPase
MARKKKNKNKSKVRVDFRKNREARPRDQNLTRELNGNELAEDLDVGERISGKGKVSRKRTIINAEAVGDQILREVDESTCLQGRVLSSIGLNSVVEGPGRKKYECTIRRVLRTMARDARNAVVTGDRVLFRQEGDDYQGVIERVEPRTGVLSRGSQRREHIIVSNVDQVVIVVSAFDPPLKPSLVDRFLVSAEKGGVRSIVCINKVDLVNPADLQPIIGIYGRLGYEVVLTSVVDGRGINRLRDLMKDSETVFSGQSGVGKSSLLNEIQPSLKLATSEVSDWSGKGRHTTRRAILMPLEVGGWVADTPGVRQFELWDVIPEEVEGYFIEFRPFVTRCRFPNCSHTHEHDCGVKGAVDQDLISILRYDSYLRIMGVEHGSRRPDG